MQTGVTNGRGCPKCGMRQRRHLKAPHEFVVHDFVIPDPEYVSAARGGRGSQNHGHKIMRRGAANDRQFAWATTSPGELLCIRGPALPSVVSGFLTADGKAGLRMKKMVRGNTRPSRGEE